MHWSVVVLAGGLLAKMCSITLTAVVSRQRQLLRLLLLQLLHQHQHQHLLLLLQRLHQWLLQQLRLRVLLLCRASASR
jgi:hypothetical protein